MIEPKAVQFLLILGIGQHQFRHLATLGRFFSQIEKEGVIPWLGRKDVADVMAI